MNLTVGGFAPDRKRALRGKGGNRGRRDNGVSPSPPRDSAPAAPDSNELTYGAGAQLAAQDDEFETSAAVTSATGALANDEHAVEERATKGRHWTPTQVRTPPRRGGKLPLIAVPGLPRAARAHRRLKPAALEWRDARVPIMGRVWARGWLPSILVAACLVALMYLVQTSGIATTGYDIQRLQNERDDWQLRNEQLEFELTKRQSLTWIESEATGRLGMVRAEPTALTYVKVAH